MNSVICISLILLPLLRVGFTAAWPSWFWGGDSDDELTSNEVDMREAELISQYYGGSGNESTPLRINVSAGMISSVAQLRGWLAAEVDLQPDLYSPLDVAGVMNGSDWHVTVYLQDFKAPPTQQDLRERFEQLKANLLWRSQWRMSYADSKPGEEFPCEFYLTGEHHVTRGRDGRLVFVYDPSRSMSYSGTFERDYHRLLHSHYDALDEASNDTTWSEVITYSRMGFSNFPSSSSVAVNYEKMIRHPVKLSKINVVDLAAVMSPAVNLLRHMSPEGMKERVNFYFGEYDKYKLVKKRDTPEFMGGRLPTGKSLAVFLAPHPSSQPLPLEECHSLKVAAARQGWPRDQVDHFLQYNRAAILKNAKAVNFPLDRLTLDFD